MLLDLFSSLDYSIFKKKIFFLKLIWVLGLFWFIFFFNFFYLKKFFFSFINKMTKETKKKMKVNILSLQFFSKMFFLVLFFFIFFNKIWGMFPFIFGVSTQLVFCFSLAITIWFSVFFSNIFFNMKSFSSHLTPEGAPLYLMLGLKKMEIFSNLIRSLTLTLRLSMKISTGHVFFVLLCKGMMSFFFQNKLFFLLFFFFSFVYIFFELGICLLQGFVFSLLCVQYLDEHKTL